MKFNVAPDARPQVKTLLIATLISIALWFVPFASYLVYPFRLFVTFVHEGGHALAALLTGSSILSLVVRPDTSGEVLAATSNGLASMIVSSAGYLGTTVFGVLLLVLIRRAVQARIVLAASAVYIAGLTLLFGLLLPLWNISNTSTPKFEIIFTLVSGLAISVGLLAIARYAAPKVAQFFLSFLAVQCVLNALFDLKNVLFMSAPFAGEMHTDAVNMYNATGVPSLFWVMMWIGISVLMVSIGLRLYAVNKQKASQQDLPFED